MRVGICVNHFHPYVGGSEIVAKNIADYISKYHKVFVFTRRVTIKNKCRNYKKYPYKIIEYSTTNFDAFNTELTKLNLDVLIVYSDMFDFFRYILTTKHAFKLIPALCGANWLCENRNFTNFLYRNKAYIDTVIVHSKHERDYTMCQSDKFQSKLVIIPNGIWLDEFDNNTLTRHNLARKIKHRQWVLNVSNFFPGKGQIHMLDILSGMPDPKKIAYIQICNDIEFPIGLQLEAIWKERVRDPLRKMGVAVHLVKNASRKTVVGFFKQSNVFAFVSEKEVAPLVLLESMAASLPWVATNVGNSKELKGGICIDTLKTGRFSSVFDRRIKGRFTENIQNACSSPELGEEGREQIINELTWGKILPRYLDVIEGKNDP